jgi:hypothetical protein
VSNLGVCGAIKNGASEVQRFPQASLWRFTAAEWQTLVPSVSCSFEMVFEEEVFHLTLPLRKLKAKERERKLWMDSILK